MRTSEFDYALPPELIAQAPAEPRDASRLLVVHRTGGRLQHSQFSDLPTYLRAGDLLVANDSRVIPARLFGRKVPTGGAVEILLLSRTGDLTWEVLLKPGRRVKTGAVIALRAPLGALDGAKVFDQRWVHVTAEVVSVADTGSRMLRFSAPIEPLLDEIGILPLPPYIHTPLERPERYQTVYARTRGSVAAPTAGLHFTDQLLGRLRSSDVQVTFVTLHVSVDTFRPVQEPTIEEHRMYSERCQLPDEACAAINSARAERRRVIAVGTTVIRVLETAGRRLRSGQQELQVFDGSTDLFIHPGFQFRVAQGLITNFHLPRSSLLMLVAAFMGKELTDKAYREAIRDRYRFYSFGDAMLIL